MAAHVSHRFLDPRLRNVGRPGPRAINRLQQQLANPPNLQKLRAPRFVPGALVAIRLNIRRRGAWRMSKFSGAALHIASLLVPEKGVPAKLSRRRRPRRFLLKKREGKHQLVADATREIAGSGNRHHRHSATANCSTNCTRLKESCKKKDLQGHAGALGPRPRDYSVGSENDRPFPNHEFEPFANLPSAHPQRAKNIAR